jgi:hypothetical protein
MTNDIAAFLTSRRARITPEQAGLPTYGKRRVPARAGVRGAGLPADAGVTLSVYTAEPGSASAEALDLLASWIATLDQETAKT